MQLILLNFKQFCFFGVVGVGVVVLFKWNVVVVAFYGNWKTTNSKNEYTKHKSAQWINEWESQSLEIMQQQMNDFWINWTFKTTTHERKILNQMLKLSNSIFCLKWSIVERINGCTPDESEINFARENWLWVKCAPVFFFGVYRFNNWYFKCIGIENWADSNKRAKIESTAFISNVAFVRLFAIKMPHWNIIRIFSFKEQ